MVRLACAFSASARCTGASARFTKRQRCAQNSTGQLNENAPSFCSQAIYDMLGACSSNRPADSAEERAKNIFAKMDENNDGQLTQDEFLKGCLQDEELSKMLAP
ncbi:hypothetical protein KM043_015309 [Ampulex compressa]|nr:hypothetical protein KM043_015309 [Ampulex compressa]